MNVEAKMREIIKENGISMVALSKKTGIEYWKLQASLSGNRELKADEYLDLCGVLGIDPMDEIRKMQSRMKMEPAS